MSRFVIGCVGICTLAAVIPLSPTSGSNHPPVTAAVKTVTAAVKKLPSAPVDAATDAQAPASQTPGATNADAELVKTAQGLFQNLRRFTLDNGLRVYLLPIQNAPTVTTMVAYRVGSADEEKDQTGLSHYLEHLMFKGTAKLFPGDIDRLTQRNGGQNNAYTSEDKTVYFFNFAADRWQIALEIEADRMRNIRIDEKHEFEQEKGAVIAELDAGEDQPWDLEYKTLLTLLWPKDSPYSHPVIGQREHVRGATAEIIKRHYDKWYYPNNAALVVVGGFDPDEATKKIKELFGPIPSGELPPRKKPTFYPERQQPIRKELESKFDVPRLMIGFNGVTVGSAEDPVLDVIHMILSGGKTSRLYRKLVEDERIAAQVDTGNESGRYPGWFGIYVELLKGKDRPKAEELVFAELRKLATEPISDAELNRARRKILASFIFSRESVMSMARAIADTSIYPVAEDVATFFKQYLEAVLKVSKDDIQRVAKQYLDPNKAAIVWSVPKDEKKQGRQAPARPEPARPALLARPSGKWPLAARHHERAEGGGGAGSFSLAAAQRVVLPNGLTVILLEDHRLPIVVASLEVADVRLREPAEKLGVATLMGNLLEEGTTKRTGKEIATLIEDTGGSLSLGATGGTVRVLTPDTDLGLGLLFECLKTPSFPADALERNREQQLSAIADAETQPRTRARQLFLSTVYGDHPLGRPSLGQREIVEKLTADDVRAFHAQAFAPNFSTIAIVGDFPSREMMKKIEALSRDWKKSTAAKPELKAPPPPQGGEKIVSDANAAQVHVFLGHLGITRNNPDYYKLLVMDNVLGVGPGFTDRLSATIRDRLGLAYTVTASITGSAGKEPGAFTGFVGTFPKNYLDVKRAFLKEIDKMRDELPTPQEVEDAKKYLLGSLPFRFTTLSAIASELLAAERHGLGFNYLEKFRQEVAAVSPADVQAVAKQYLNPQGLVIVAVGAIDHHGKPLAKK
ncbi:MAG: pitrilysin family protein [Gemmataceae bacterium]|nr:insulinase family protein [Gemmata sp.]MDW8197359.1 pitrilysin family protein [Gemmataceae bacterium]